MDKLDYGRYYDEYISVLANGISGKSFRPDKEIRLGDPISSYIFITRAEYFCRYIYFTKMYQNLE